MCALARREKKKKKTSGNKALSALVQACTSRYILMIISTYVPTCIGKQEAASAARVVVVARDFE